MKIRQHPLLLVAAPSYLTGECSFLFACRYQGHRFLLFVFGFPYLALAC